ncbi:MAG: hypothetical protein RR527_08615, partial [Clostridia bacterium]
MQISYCAPAKPEICARVYRQTQSRYPECRLGAGKPYGKAYEVTELGFRMMVHLYYDPTKAAKGSENLQVEIQRLENELSAMDEPPDKKKHYDKYFFINCSKDGKLGLRGKIP